MFIVPLWNWNCLPTLRNFGRYQGVYRTIVELKHTGATDTYGFGMCVYRTIVELKLSNRAGKLGSGWVFIVPLWNWNFQLQPPITQLFLCLSYHCGIETLVVVGESSPRSCVYRTIVELKHYEVGPIIVQWKGVYRTIVELKPARTARVAAIAAVCLSYHCGIETAEPYGY